jgi:hypothetical protein
MNVMDMLLVIAGVLLFMRIVGLVALILVGHDSRPARHAHPVPPAVDPCLAAVQGLPPGAGPPEPARHVPGRLGEESILLGRLRTGDLDRERYRAAMAELAHRDSRAHVGKAPTTRPSRASR